MKKIQIIAEIEIDPVNRADLLGVLQALEAGSRSEAGNKRYDLAEDIDHPGHFFVVEEWLSEKAVEEHCASRHFQAFVAAIEGKAKKLNIIKVKNLFE